MIWHRHALVVTTLAIAAIAIPLSPVANAFQVTVGGSLRDRNTTTSKPTTPSQTQKPKPATTAPAAMTNHDVIQLAKAKLSDSVIISKIRKSKTKFDMSTNGLVALKQAGVSDAVISAMMDAANGAATPSTAPSQAPAPRSNSNTSSTRPTGPASNTSKNVAPTETANAHSAPTPPAHASAAPQNYGVYIYEAGGLKPLGRIETKVQVSKFRSLLKSVVPFVRQKIDINVPGAHSTSRFEATRPTFFAYFPPSRDVSKFKLLQCKITGQNFDQRTVANASIMFSTEQNQDEVLLTSVPPKLKISIACIRAKI